MSPRRGASTGSGWNSGLQHKGSKAKLQKVNFVPRTDHEDPEGEQRYSSTLSVTMALDKGGWLTPRPGRFALPQPGFDPRTASP